MSESKPRCLWSLEQFQTTMSRCPFNRWLGLKALEVSDAGVELLLPWRDELLSSPEAQSMHGGVLASVVDAAGAYAVGAFLGRAVPTIDLRVDYHKVAKPGNYIAKGRVIKLGRTVASADTQIFNDTNILVASGRGLYFTGGNTD